MLRTVYTTGASPGKDLLHCKHVPWEVCQGQDGRIYTADVYIEKDLRVWGRSTQHVSVYPNKDLSDGKKTTKGAKQRLPTTEVMQAMELAVVYFLTE